ncbi:MAG: DNA translocase FtsK [Epsilonproteobacteria bacterium]|nr:DNA translocase FtsK [Campylobacterota bacterium]
MVGSIGETIGTYNKVYFGYLSFIYPFVLIGLLFLLFQNRHIDLGRLNVILPTFLILISILVFQSHIVDGYYYGALGGFIVSFLKAYIGGAGIWIFILSTFILGSILISDALELELPEQFSFSGYFRQIKARIDDFLYRDNSEDLYPIASEERVVSQTKPTKQIKQLHSYEEAPIETQTHEVLALPDSIETLLHHQEEYSVEHEVQKVPADTKLEAIKQESQTLIHEEERVEPAPKSTTQKAKVVKELEENKKLLNEIKQGKTKKPKNFKLPYFDFLKSAPKKKSNINENEIDEKIANLLEKLKQFKIEGDVVRTYSGPVVTTFEFRPAAHIKVSKILTLQDDLAMALKAQTIRIQAPIPGKDVVGIEIPNKSIETIYLKEILQTDLFQKASSPLTMVVGKDIVGNPFVTDLTKLPHLLIAGTTGSGKSVGINAMLVSLLYRNSPDDLKLLMIDPKMLEFSIYNDIPHLLTPVITQAKQAILALANMVVEMERRYKMMSKTKTKNIENYNEKAKKEGFDTFPYIIIIIDELADLMMTSGKDVEFYIARLAQMARASGIHLIVATQRPSVDVVTGLIKANLPSRISFRVGQKIDSKVILDSTGADSLLGRGDMLFTPPGSSGLIRLHAPFVTEKEIETIVEFLKVQREVVYDPSFLSEPSGSTVSESPALSMSDSKGGDGDFDELYEEAKAVVLNDKKTSISYLQRKLQIGYNRSARIIEQLEMMGVISAPNTKGQREILE